VTLVIREVPVVFVSHQQKPVVMGPRFRGDDDKRSSTLALNLTARFGYTTEWTCIEAARPTPRKQALSR
jgi:hypothetical protein